VRGLSLKTRLLLAPTLGLGLVLVLAVGYVWQAERQNAVIKRIANQDLQLLDRYTDLFTDLSRHHMLLYELLYDAGRQVDEGEIYDRGRNLLDGISASTRDMIELSQVKASEINLGALSGGAPDDLVKRLESYRSAATSAIEMTTVALQYAAAYLNEANKHFTFMHSEFAARLDQTRSELRRTVKARVSTNRRRTTLLAVGGLIMALSVSLFGYLLSLRLSRNLQKQITALNELSSANPHAEQKGELLSNDEVSSMGRAIAVFRTSLNILKQQERDLAEKNRRLQDEIQARARVETALREAKQELEQRVLERTRTLTTTNEALREEIDQRMRAEARLHLYKQVIDNTNEAVIITDGQAKIIEVNPAYERLLGYSRQELIGRTPRVVRSGIHDADFYRRMWKSIEHRGHWCGEICDRNKAGELIPFWLTINGIKDEDGTVSKYIGLFRDIREAKLAERQLEQIAYFDPLTGLANRTLLEKQLQDAVKNARVHGYQLVVLFIDLDRFKHVNDTYGHSAGDALLKLVSDRLRQSLRDTDMVARMGGDEFTVILGRIEHKTDATQVATKIIAAVRKPTTIGDTQVSVGASIGLAFFPEHGESADTLKKNADIAMYQAKDAGRNRYQVFDPALQHRDAAYRAMVKAIGEACDLREFTLFYQPIIDIATWQPVGGEALIRWPRSHGPQMVPSEFVPVAEEAGIMQRIDGWLLEKACRFAVVCLEQGNPEYTVHVNLASTLFQTPEIPRLIAQVLYNTGLPPQNLCLEITETAVISEPELARNILLAITEMGVSVALDDFGSGFSSLTHLTRFPLRKIKIDRSFMHNALIDGATEVVVRSMIDLARNMGIAVVAEGVEEMAQHEFLEDLGCQFGQGYFYGEPMTESAFLQWLEARPPAPSAQNHFSRS
jgi:diguanylate cyclase (GGDEF)-like protein/PAS domain S-box-containing protein